MNEKVTATMRWVCDTKNCHRFEVIGRDLSGSLYFTKSAWKNGTPGVVTVEYQKDSGESGDAQEGHCPD